MSMLGGADVRSIVPDLPRGMTLLRDGSRNKGTVFTEQERYYQIREVIKSDRKGLG